MSELLTKHLRRVGFYRREDGKLIFAPEAKADRTGVKAIYCDSVIKYVNAFEPTFRRALETSEFEFVSLLIRVRGLEDPGWDPYESTKATGQVCSRSDSVHKDINYGFMVTSLKRQSLTRS